jgi:hypothetical protein
MKSCATSNGKKTQKREARASTQARISVVRSQLLLYPNATIAKEKFVDASTKSIF